MMIHRENSFNSRIWWWFAGQIALILEFDDDSQGKLL